VGDDATESGLMIGSLEKTEAALNNTPLLDSLAKAQ
jgi:hypothetical protein